MKKVKTFSGVLLLVVLSLVFVRGYHVKAAASSVTVNQDSTGGTFTYVDDTTNHTGEWQRLTDSDGNVYYCYQRSTQNWPNGTTMSLVNADSEIDKGLTYILENGYPNKTILDGGDKDRYITQGAIWLYAAGSTMWTGSFATATDTNGLIPKMEALAAAARSYDGSGSNGISLSVSDKNMTLSSDKTYYQSVAMSPTVTGATQYTVSLSGAPTGASVRTTSGETKSGNQFAANEQFVVRVPASAVSQVSNITVTVSAGVTTKKAYIYSPAGWTADDSSAYQQVVTLGETTTTATSSVRLTASKDVVCVDYKIIGNVIPKAELTDPTPDSTCIDKGDPYDQEKELTTKQEGCKFTGWFTKDDLTGKWVDGTALNNNMTLYGAWECPSIIQVPATAAGSSLVIVGTGFVAIAAGIGFYLFKNKKVSKI